MSKNGVKFRSIIAHILPSGGVISPLRRKSFALFLLSAMAMDLQGLSISTAEASTCYPPGAVNVLNYGVKGDCQTDDSASINAIVNGFYNCPVGTQTGELYFPKPPGGCYLVNSPVALNSKTGNGESTSITLKGDGRGVTVIRAGLKGMDAVLQKGQAWYQGDTVTDITFDANGLANYAVHVWNGTDIKLDRIEGLNALVADLFLDSVGQGHGNSYTADSLFTNTISFPPYNILLNGSSDGVYLNNVLENASVANVFENGGGTNHFIGNRAYSWPLNLCPKYSFITAYSSIWQANESDCSTVAAFLISTWGSSIVNNTIQGAQGHGICISPWRRNYTGDQVIVDNVMFFTNAGGIPDTNPNPANAIVQGAVKSGNDTCAEPVENAEANGNSINVVQGNSSSGAGENLWNTLFPGHLKDSPALGVGVSPPRATLDVNGYVRLAINWSAPATCDVSKRGAIALTSASRICLCNGRTWNFNSSGSPCAW